MALTIISFIDLLLVALLVGTMFGIWIGFNPAGLSASTYVEQQQHTIRALNTLMPLLGAICIVLTIALAVLTKDSPRARYLLVSELAISRNCEEGQIEQILAKALTKCHLRFPELSELAS